MVQHSAIDHAGVTGVLSNPMTTLDDIIVGGASGVPGRLAKGSDGQVLTVSASTHHLVWATPSAGSVATDAIWDAKGDLAGGTGANTAVKLTVGSNGQVLTADSGETTGMKWATAAAGFTPAIGRVHDIASSNATTTGTSFADLLSMSITITTGAHSVELSFSCMAGNNGGNSTVFDFTVDGTRVGDTLGSTGTNNATDSVSMRHVTTTLSAASHTFKVQWRVTGNTGTVFAHTTGLAVHFAAVELGA
jgi:hypothetical protein